MRERGCSLEEIKRELGTDWCQEEQRHRRTYNFLEASRVLDRQAADESFIDSVLDKANEFLLAALSLEGSHALVLGTSRRALREKVMHLMQDGYSPVMAFDGREVLILPDFYVSHLLRAKEDGGPWLVVPLRVDARQAWSGVRPDLPTAPVYEPANIVRVQRGDTVTDIRFRCISPSEFEFVEVGKGRKPKKRKK
jgi:hypothetical protein